MFYEEIFKEARVMLDEMKKSGIITDIAETYKEFLDAYMDAGFTRKEAVEILANQGFTIKPQISDRILGNKRT